MAKSKDKTLLQKMQEICPYTLRSMCNGICQTRKKDANGTNCANVICQFKSKDGTNKTEEFCENNWLIRDDAQKAIKIYMKNMRTLNTMQIYPEDDEQGTERRCQCC